MPLPRHSLLGNLGMGQTTQEKLFSYVYDNFSLDLLLFQAIHFACAQTFDEIKAKLSAIAEEDGSPNYFSAEEIYFVQLDQMSNLGDQALADKIANGMVPDLWPILET